MTMSEYERTREIGIRKAIGASIARTWAVLVESVSSVLGVPRGSPWLHHALAVNAAPRGCTVLFLTTPRLAIGSLAFAVVLGTPAVLPHTARRPPEAVLASGTSDEPGPAATQRRYDLHGTRGDDTMRSMISARACKAVPAQ
jgi:hypothetical protein